MSLCAVVAVPMGTRPVERLGRELAPEVQVVQDLELLPAARYPGDHRGAASFVRSPEQQRRWEALLGEADVLLGFPGDRPEGLAWAVRHCPRLCWVQATADGVGQQVRASGLTEAELARVEITKATGIHAGPLAEFCLFGLLAFAKDLPRLRADQRTHRWESRPVGELAGRTVLILGLGPIGQEVARLAKAFGMRTVGVSRSGATAGDALDETHPTEALGELLGNTDALVVTLPLTDATRGLVDGEVLGRLRRGAIVVNVGRGEVVDEPALLRGLADGHLGGAALDVASREPPAHDSPLWVLENVLLSPHTAALTPSEDERICALFARNLRHFLAGEELEGSVDVSDGY